MHRTPPVAASTDENHLLDSSTADASTKRAGGDSKWPNNDGKNGNSGDNMSTNNDTNSENGLASTIQYSDIGAMSFVHDDATSMPSTLGGSNEASQDALDNFRGQFEDDLASSPQMNLNEAEQIMTDVSNSLGVDSRESAGRGDWQSHKKKILSNFGCEN